VQRGQSSLAAVYLHVLFTPFEDQCISHVRGSSTPFAVGSVKVKGTVM